ncbi:MAG TPA: 3-dehydroquinate synthase [Candidatus Acidoferrales bacterium]|nr:3-dehydroquinate synthase [Candidatus Acidoferrales bacterium]
MKSSAGRYSVHCEPGALARAGPLLADLGDSTGTFILSSPRVWRHCGRAVARAIPGRAARHPILFDDREASKRLATVEEIARKLVAAGADRRAIVVAVGGGVVGDVAGFAAAMYLRGVRLVHIPTTVVAQVDSAIGGKTGVDLAEGKNLVGAFYPPKLVVADPALLHTLPHRDYRSGLYEVIKYGVIADRQLFAFLERRMPAVVRRDPAALGWIIPRSIAIKARVVSADEHEGGRRQILNFGHTLGHAIETATRYRLFLHGEAIAWGMIAATMMALATDRLPLMDAFRIVRLVTQVGPLPEVPAIPAAKLRSILAGDKKARGGRVLWVFPHRIGKAGWGIPVEWPLVEKIVRSLPEIMREARSATPEASGSRRAAS